MKLKKITTRSIMLVPNSKAITLQQIDRCYECCKEGGFLVHNNQAYSFTDFAEFLYALELEQEKLEKVYEKYCIELLETNLKTSESAEMLEYRQHIADAILKK